MMRECVKEWLMEQFGGAEAAVKEVWAEYLSSTAERIAEARTALAADDFPELDSVAHRLKGNALMVGDQPLAMAAVALRDAAKASDPVAAAKAIESLAEFDRENHA